VSIDLNIDMVTWGVVVNIIRMMNLDNTWLVVNVVNMHWLGVSSVVAMVDMVDLLRLVVDRLVVAILRLVIAVVRLMMDNWPWSLSLSDKVVLWSVKTGDNMSLVRVVWHSSLLHALADAADDADQDNNWKQDEHEKDEDESSSGCCNGSATTLHAFLERDIPICKLVS
jgi:hypothetical protein